MLPDVDARSDRNKVLAVAIDHIKDLQGIPIPPGSRASERAGLRGDGDDEDGLMFEMDDTSKMRCGTARLEYGPTSPKWLGAHLALEPDESASIVTPPLCLGDPHLRRTPPSATTWSSSAAGTWPRATSTSCAPFLPTLKHPSLTRTPCCNTRCDTPAQHAASYTPHGTVCDRLVRDRKTRHPRWLLATPRFCDVIIFGGHKFQPLPQPNLTLVGPVAGDPHQDAEEEPPQPTERGQHRL